MVAQSTAGSALSAPTYASGLPVWGTRGAIGTLVGVRRGQGALGAVKAAECGMGMSGKTFTPAFVSAAASV